MLRTLRWVLVGIKRLVAVTKGEEMKGLVTSIICGLIFFALFSTHPILATVITPVSAIVILLFWTGAVGIKLERN